MKDIVRLCMKCVAFVLTTFFMVGASMSFGADSIEEVVVTAKSMKTSQHAAIDAK